MIDRVHILKGGYCGQLLAAVDGRSLKWVRFPSTYIALHHLVHGWVICDTGYGGRFDEATKSFPYRFYRWVTPVRDTAPITEGLRRHGIAPSDVAHVIVTHFHADHVGGLKDFPTATIHYQAEALHPLLRLSPLSQVRAAFLPALIPSGLETHGRAIGPEEFTQGPELPFLQHDLFRDGSLYLIDLPGHAPGHVGVLWHESAGPTLYCSDAYWRREQLEGTRRLPRISRGMQWDPSAYEQTLSLLREVHRNRTHRLFACHE